MWRVIGMGPDLGAAGRVEGELRACCRLCYPARPFQRYQGGSTMAVYRAARVLLAAGLPSLGGNSRALAMSAAPALDGERRR